MLGEKILTLNPNDTVWITNRAKIDKPNFIRLLNQAPGNILLKMEFSAEGKYFYLTNSDDTYLQFKRSDSAKIDHLSKNRTRLFVKDEVYEIYLNYADASTKEARNQVLVIEFKDSMSVNVYLR
ncbi:hypothetical protein A2572_02865 [Candidatus Collierbacteria bacterium RIFOXYD1_FULL_40_9]|uniref:Uncharacterized protein n=1 Tax=Candidatus Collierbacteria bacterium RIFOXYD1_FULL_40_9 TaxID=1817731 RepID=A0A1F5FU53_9BACT|nr:MAG: hypothetical protein A2572_02865 [Candidatus Collierbacteria bacterium RIFOXYD1_FULL_40_9]